MKLIFTFTLFLSLWNLSYSQTYTKVSLPQDKLPAIASETNKTSAKTSANNSVAHSQLAVKQLRENLSENIEYPAEMLNNGIEGRIVIKVLISKNGQIQEFEIIKSPHLAFHPTVLNAMKNIKHLDLKERKYDGVPVIYVPIDFSIGQ